MSTDGCDDWQEAIAELALGTLTGRDRASTLAHVDECNPCRRHLNAFADAADALLLIAPETQPPPDLGALVLAQFRRDHPPKPRAPRLAAAAAALALVIGGISATALARTTQTSLPSASGMQNVQVARFDASVGEHVTGQVFAPTGNRRWIFMVVHDTTRDESYSCELELADGQTLAIGRFGLRHGVAGWGRTLEAALRIRRVRLLDSDGKIAAIATMQ